MSTTGLDVFDRSLNETNLWLKTLMEKLKTSDRRVAYIALRATLHALRDRIGPQNAVHLGAQFPTLLRGVYYEGWHMRAKPTKERHKGAFLDHVRLELRGEPQIDIETAVRAVFEVMWDKIDPGEVAKIMDLLPAEIRGLWPQLAGAN